MDPLSITAGIVAVLQATDAVISVCSDYSAAVKNSSWELPRVTEEVKSLRDVLEQFADRADPASETQLPVLKLLCEPGGGQLAMCLVELKALEKKLAPPSWSGQSGSKRRGLIQAFLGWPLKKGDTKKILENIERFKATLNLAITADQVTLMSDMQDAIQKNLAKLDQSFTRMRKDDRREKLHEWLEAPDPSLNYIEACKKRQATTGAWIFDNKQFADWKTNPDSFLWLYGIPGCGKTILSSTIIENVLHHCDQDPSFAVVYFYFDFNDIEKQLHEKMIRSLIKQLSMQSANTPRALESLFSSCINGGRQPTVPALLETLQRIVDGFKRTFIILDALDECRERRGLLEDIEEIARWKTGKLHILTTSRREKDIEESLEPLVNGKDKICIQSALVSNDIKIYIHERLQSDRRLQKWQKMPEAQEEIEKTLMDGAGGMFRWAVCQLDALGTCLSLYDLRKALASLPETLDATYARILCSIPEKLSQRALKILQWLAYSARPLRVEEVAEVIIVDIESNPQVDLVKRLSELQDILTICSSLVTITVPGTMDPYDGTDREQVRLAHFSVKEYLVSERIQSGPATRYSIQEISTNVSIAEVCLAYLLQFDSPNSLTVQTDKEFPLAGYAAEYWTRHARVAGKDEIALHLLVMDLFLSKGDAYVNWIRRFDLDTPWQSLYITENIAPPLYYASLAGLAEPARLLLEKGADVNAQGGGYGNALQAASFRGYDQVVQQLLQKGADANAQGGWFGNALQAASLRGNGQVVRRLLENGADANVQGGEYGNALQAACFGSYDQVVQQLLQKGADANAQGGQFGNALQAASLRGNGQVVRRLLENGADTNVQGGEYGNALQAACFGSYDQVVQQLLQKGADVNAPGGWFGNALQAASYRGNDQVVQRLLENKANINAQGGEYGNALQAASYRGHDQVVQRLLENKANTNAQGGEYGNALQAASLGGHDRVVQQLLKDGADVNAQGGRYGNALQVASFGGHDQIVQRLLENGADANAQGGGFGNALQAACLGGHDQVVQQLLQKGADVNAPGGRYGNALQAASFGGYDQIVQRLLEHGAVE